MSDVYHIGLSKKDVSGIKYAVLPGDPDRCELIASLCDKHEHLGTNREYNSYIGYLGNEKILIISTGMGGPSTAICVEELHILGINNLIRVGTCGGMQLDVDPGDLIIATSAVRSEGTSKEYLPIECPAVADFELLSSIINEVKKENIPYHVGVVHSKDSFYGQHEPERMPVYNDLKTKWKAYIKAGVLASEMETAALYSVASVLKMKAVTILLVIWNQEQINHHIEKESVFDTSLEIKVALNTIRSLINK